MTKKTEIFDTVLPGHTRSYSNLEWGLCCALAILTAILLAPLAALHAAENARPNIILILADDLGYGDVRCYNAEAKVATPHIDRLAREGMRFTDAHSPATVCTPTRYSLMTGQMAFRVPNGGTVFTGAGGPSLIAPGRLTLPAMLRQQGYATACFGKWHVGLTFRDKKGAAIHQGGIEAVRRIDCSRCVEGGPLDHGFDRFFGTACCPTTDWLYAFIENDRVLVAPTGPLDKSKLAKHPYANDCQGYNSSGATACATLARFQVSDIGGWDFKANREDQAVMFFGDRKIEDRKMERMRAAKLLLLSVPVLNLSVVNPCP